MSLVLTEEQRLLRDTAQEFLATNAPVDALRTLRDTKDPDGYSTALWQQMAELGWPAIALPEEYGGLEFGFLGMGVVIEETGRNLTASPLLASAVIGTTALCEAGSNEQKSALLPELAQGNITVTMALEESHRHDPAATALPAELDDDEFVLNGKKCFVIEGHCADWLIVVVRTSGAAGDKSGLTLLLTAGDTPGISRRRTSLMDSRNYADIEFDQVRIPASQCLGTIDEGWEALEKTLDLARLAIAAEMYGGALECFDRTINYLQEREQFGVKIGSFQALQHRAAHLYSELELNRSVLLQALSAVDENPEQLPVMASMAKARMNDLYMQVTNEAVQMHGGIGVTDELDIGLFLKRARVCAQLFGDTGYHMRRYAELSGF